MFLSSKTPLVAFDVGSHSIKLAQLTPLSRNRFELTNFGIMPLREDCIVDGVVKKHDEVVEAVMDLVKAEKIKTDYAIASVAGEAVIIKKIKVPQMSHEELENSIAEEAEQYIPFDIDDVSIDFQILGPSASSAGGEDSVDEANMDILLVAVQREMIYNRTDVLIDAGLKPVIVDLDVFAMVNAISLTHDLTEMGAVALIDLGESFTHVNILLDGVTAYTRDIPVGGGYCSRKIMSAFDVSYREVTDLKGGKIPPEIDSDKVIEVITGAFEKPLDEIQKCFEFFSTTSNMEVEKILLSGGGAMIQGVDGFFADQLKVPVELVDPLKGVKINSKNFDKATVAEMAPLCTVAIGLATRRFDYQ